MILYHYTSGQGLFGIISSGELHCSNINFLNDPSEKSYFQDLLTSVFNESTESKEIYKALYSDSFQRSVLTPGETFIASFSKNDDSLSMWNYYAKGNGYNIGLDIDSVIKENEDIDLSIQKVELIYDQEQQMKSTLDFILKHRQAYKEFKDLDERLASTILEDEYYHYSHLQHGFVGDFNIGIYRLGLGFKHKAYETEQEVRLIISENEAARQTTKFKVSDNGVFVQYIPIKLSLETNIESITTHPLNGQLHLEGIEKFFSSTFRGQKTKTRVSTIPFRIV
jgi:hypothetical protein